MRSLILPALLLLGFASACNKSTENGEEVIVVTPATVAVNNFYLQADSKVLDDLDSVFFSIDLNKGIIFNADSLPKGTSVKKLIPVITFANTMSVAELVYTDESGTRKTVDYLETKTDSIDFSNDVLLNVTAADNVNTYTYTIKVNVHKEEPDSLMWDKIAIADLPARGSQPLRQKTVMKDASVFTLIEESDNSFTLAETENLEQGYASAKEISLPFVPDMESLVATTEAFYMLDTDGMLFSSDDMENWTATGEVWTSIVGGYLNCVLGIKDTDNGLMHVHYPASDIIKDAPVEADFPLTGRSATVTLSNKWSPEPTVFFIGGKTADGSLSEHTWGFDGSLWTTIDNTPLPAMEGAMLVKYVIYRTTGHAFSEVAYDAWFAIGGRFENGSYSRNIYMSLDNGVNWKKASELMQLPDYIPAIYAADALVLSSELNADLSDIWMPTPAKKPARWLTRAVEIDGNDITWDCPYIYLIGGSLPGGKLSDKIWRGVLTRLTFTPII